MNKVSAKEALKKLIDGNRRFSSERQKHPRQNKDRILRTVKIHDPFAVVIGCSDSRTPPEIIFDQGLGDLFTIRAAGNTVDNVCVGSVEYAVEHLGVELVLVLGHKNCGVFKTAASGDDVHHHLGSLVATAQKAVSIAKTKPGCIIENAVKENVSILIKKLENDSPTLHKYIKKGKLKIVGGYYDLETGKVEMLKKHQGIKISKLTKQVSKHPNCQICKN